MTAQSWFQEFISLRGTAVLAQTLQNISRSGQSRYGFFNDLPSPDLKVFTRSERDILLEYEVVKCLRQILNSVCNSTVCILQSDFIDIQDGINDVLNHPSIVTHISSSLNSPHPPTRRIILELLTYLIYWKNGCAGDLVISALEVLSTANGEAAGYYNFWFKSLEHILSGRGKWGTKVGASEEVRRTAGIDGSLNDYAVGWT